MKAVANVRRFPILRNRIVSINNVSLSVIQISNPLARLLLTAKHCFGFGYLPLNSKYYHDVLPNNVNEVMLMITK